MKKLPAAVCPLSRSAGEDWGEGDAARGDALTPDASPKMGEGSAGL